jgi:hypothetical protein
MGTFAGTEPQSKRLWGRWVRSLKNEALSRLILFGVGSLRQAL